MIVIPFKTLIDNLLHTNQFASGGLLLMILGGVGAALRKVPKKIYEHFLHLFSMTVTITDDSKAFIWFKWWFQEHKRSTVIRHVDIFTPSSEKSNIAFLFPSPGNHWFVYNKRPFRMTFTRSEEKKTSIDTWRSGRSESIVLRILGRNQKFIREFVDDVRQKYEKQSILNSKLFLWDGDWWNELSFNPRPLDSVILPTDQKQKIINDINKFLSGQSWYNQMGMPYHRSYLFYGPPGTGKTSFLLGIASHFKFHIYLLKLSTLNDAKLADALRKVEKNSMVVLEDIDCVIRDKKIHTHVSNKNSKKKTPIENEKDKRELLSVTLSGLLNALDGIETPGGVLFFLTTNYINKLDAALLRPGRIDIKELIDLATESQKIEMYSRFYGGDISGADEFIKKHPKANTMAEFQELLKVERPF